LRTIKSRYTYGKTATIHIWAIEMKDENKKWGCEPNHDGDFGEKIDSF
jgi:hypothetical protein